MFGFEVDVEFVQDGIVVKHRTVVRRARIPYMFLPNGFDPQQFEIKYNYSETWTSFLLMAYPCPEMSQITSSTSLKPPQDPREAFARTENLCRSYNAVYSDPSRAIAVSLGNKFDAALADSECCSIWGSSSRISKPLPLMTCRRTTHRLSMRPAILRAIRLPKVNRWLLLPTSRRSTSMNFRHRLRERNK